MIAQVLIVEDDPLIAMDLEAIAEEAGAMPTVCASVREARALVLALLDIDVVDGKTFALAQGLRDRKVPVCFVSAVRQADIPADLADAPLLAKPYRPAELRDAIRQRV
jgi:DNA-binding response OmpR family regulator